MENPFESEWASFEEAYKSIDASNLKEIDDLRVRFLGKKGSVAGLMKQMGGLSKEERPAFGKEVNVLKQRVDAKLQEIKEKAKEEELQKALEEGYVDVTLPGKGLSPGVLHPLLVVREQMVDFFRGLGFKVEEGREVETDWYNFEALNIPPDHPARDMQDTFYVKEKVVLRTQTSGVQIHVMENKEPPIRMIAPGVVYRVDSDATHAPMFQQLEGLVVDENISFAHLKAILLMWAQEFFGEKITSWEQAKTPLTGIKINKFKHMMARVDIKDVESMTEESKENNKGEASKSDWNDSPEPLKDEPLTEEITFDDFMKPDLRVARIVEANEVPEARKLIQLTLSLGGDERRNVFAGIKSAYNPDDLVGRLVIMVANLAPRKMKFGVSEGMVIASGPGRKDVFLISPDEGSLPGQRVH